MKAKLLTKRVLSVLLATVMLFSCWVFTAPQADAAGDNIYSGTAGTYYIKVSIQCTNATDNDWSSNNTYVHFYGKTQAGADCSTNITGIGNSSSDDNWFDYYGSMSGLPTKFDLYISNYYWGATRLFLRRIYISCDNNWSNGNEYTLLESDIGCHKSNHAGSQTAKATFDISSGKLSSSNSNNVSWSDKGTDVYSNVTVNNYSKPYPVVTSCTMPNYSTAFSKGNTPGASSNFVNVSSSSTTNALSGNVTYSPTTIKDQWGVNIGGTLTPYYVINNRYRSSGSSSSWSSNSDTSSYSITSSNGTVTASKAASYPYHYCTVKLYLTWSSNNTNYDTGSTKNAGFSFPTVKLNYVKYYTTFSDPPTEMDADNPQKEYTPYSYSTTVHSSQDVLWGDVPTAAPPTLTTAQQHYYFSSAHYQMSTWTNPTTGLTSDTNTRISESSKGSHSWSGTWASFEGEEAWHGFSPDNFHRQSCSLYTNYVGAHYKFQWHQWDTPTFTFADDGKTATVTRQCTTNGCKQTQTQSLSLNSGITSAVQTAATCTTVGTTRYTATSPWGDGTTKTKDVNDIPALTHSWKTPTFTFASDGKTAKATRVCNRDATHTETQAAVVTSKVKTQPTCTNKGTTTYTATSPWGDGATGTKDVQDISALGHDVAGVELTNTDAEGHYRICKRCAEPIKSDGITIGKDTHTMSDWAKKDDDRHTRSCNICGYTETGDHACTSNVHKPTCTEQGYTEYKCGTCPYSYKDNYTAATGHDAAKLDTDAIAYESNGTTHWKTCDWCDQAVYKNAENTWVIGTDGHNPVTTKRDATTLVTPATCTEAGVYHHVCSVCASVLTSEYTVTDGGEGKALAHKDSIAPVEAQAPGDNVGGKIVFHCSLCDQYFAAKESADGKSFEADTSETYATAESAVDYSDEIPAPQFNSYVDPDIYDGDGNEYDYGLRGASLKLTKETEEGINTIQKMRFSGSVAVPENVGNVIDTSNTFENVGTASKPNYQLKSKEALEADTTIDDCILDFGFVYTQMQIIAKDEEADPYVPDLSKLVINNDVTAKISKMSVPSKNINAGSLDISKERSTWAGVTPHDDSGVKQLTFNLLINIKEKNWKRIYAARTYITYKYHGKVYTVYDATKLEDNYFSARAVWYVAKATLAKYEDVYPDDSYDETTQIGKMCKFLRDNITEKTAGIGESSNIEAFIQKHGNGSDWWKYINIYEDYGLAPNEYDYPESE